MTPTEAERHTLLMRECQDAENIVREIVHEDQRQGHLSWDESPLKPFIIDQARSILVYRHTKTSCMYGSGWGTGILLTRIPTAHQSLINWSAPLFLTVSMKSFGISLGSTGQATFSVNTSRKMVSALSKPGGRSISGFDIGVGCGHRLQDRADVLSVTFGAGLDSVGVSKVTGTAFDFSFNKGRICPDEAKNKLVYGENANYVDILAGKLQAPTEFQPLYAELSRIVNRVERPSANPARTSASLERFSTGRDPDAVMVMPNGISVREDLKAPPPGGMALIDRTSAASSLASF